MKLDQNEKDAIKQIIKEAMQEVIEAYESSKLLDLQDTFLSIAETAEIFKVGPPTIKRWAHEKILCPYVVGNQMIFSKKEIFRLIKNSKKKDTARLKSLQKLRKEQKNDEN